MSGYYHNMVISDGIIFKLRQYQPETRDEGHRKVRIEKWHRVFIKKK